MSTIEKAAAKLVTKHGSGLPSTRDSTSIAEKAADKVGQIGRDSTAQIGHSVDNPGARPAPSMPLPPPTKVCELDFEWLGENGFLVPGSKNQQQAQEFRRIKRPLLLNLQPQVAAEYPLPTNVIFVTSSVPGEGKTFVSLNLALSLSAELDRQVLLIDGDAAKGDLSKWLGINEEKGLVDHLRMGDGDLEEAVIGTNVERLSVMPSGMMSDNIDELFASTLMGTVVQNLAARSESRIILVDGPPLIATTEAAVLARRMGQVVMVVEANKTPQSLVEEAASQLVGSQLVSLLLNKATTTGSNNYGYGYGYGYGAHAEEAP